MTKCFALERFECSQFLEQAKAEGCPFIEFVDFCNLAQRIEGAVIATGLHLEKSEFDEWCGPVFAATHGFLEDDRGITVLSVLGEEPPHLVVAVGASRGEFVHHIQSFTCRVEIV